MKAPLALVLVLVAAVSLAGCSSCSTCDNDKEFAAGAATDPVALCIDLCKASKANGTDFEKGPCLSDEIRPDWVCDVAHNPRWGVDNLPENQCPAFGNTAHHFVEVDTDCNPIKQY